MCKIIEDMREEAREQGRIEGMIDLVKKGLLTPAQAVVYAVAPEPSARTFRATLPHFESHLHGV